MPKAKAVYGTSPVKRKRRSKAQLGAILDAAKGVIDDTNHRLTIRHLFYRLVSAGVIDKTEGDYKSLTAHLAKWRRAGEVPFTAFADSTRWWYRANLSNSPEAALRRTAEGYRRDLWISQPHYVEVWCEKEAIAAILRDVTDPWGLPLFVCRGFPSLSALQSASQAFLSALDEGKEPHILYLGDHDPSGKAIDTAVQNSLSDDFGVEVDFHRIAVTPSQIDALDLPTRPVKRSDSRAKGWEGGCVEVDAMRPEDLTDVVATAAVAYIDQEEWRRMEAIEKAEKESFRAIAAEVEHAGGVLGRFNN